MWYIEKCSSSHKDLVADSAPAKHISTRFKLLRDNASERQLKV